MTPLTRLRRLGYRTAYLLLRLYWLAKRPDKHGVKCVITAGDHFLLVRHTYGRWEWDLPGGGVKRREAPIDSARREMEEELGLLIDGWESLGELRGTIHHHRDRIQVFRASLPPQQIEFDLGELAGARWFTAGTLPRDVGRYVRPALDRALQPGR